MRTISLGGAKAAGRVALVDDADFESVSTLSWQVYERVRPAGGIDGPYAQANVWREGRRTRIFLHTLITGYRMTDHANHDGLDCQRSNLRPASRSQNGANRRPDVDAVSSVYKGVTWDDGAWAARIRDHGKLRRLGRFATPEDAARAYDAAASATFGEYANLNF